MKKIISIIVAVLVLAVLAIIFVGSRQAQAPVNNPGNSNQQTGNQPGNYSDLIKVTAPLANADVKSPLNVTGEARGSWYFEAVFPVRLLDANGNVLAQGPAHAQGDWMTNDFVPFTVQLIFAKPKTAVGVLVLERDNPSGLPQNANAVTIPVHFDTN